MQGIYLRRMFMAGLVLPSLYLADAAPGAVTGMTVVRQAHAVVGAPLTPLSAAGVARRTTARAATASAATASAAPAAAAPPPPPPQAAAAPAQAAAPGQAAASEPQAAAPGPAQPAAARPAGAPAIGTVVHTLPEGCQPETRDGVEYQNCAGIYYRTAFQGNNLVYVVQ